MIIAASRKAYCSMIFALAWSSGRGRREGVVRGLKVGFVAARVGHDNEIGEHDGDRRRARGHYYDVVGSALVVDEQNSRLRPARSTGRRGEGLIRPINYAQAARGLAVTGASVGAQDEVHDLPIVWIWDLADPGHGWRPAQPVDLGLGWPVDHGPRALQVGVDQRISARR
jgi:hypothetical protein